MTPADEPSQPGRTPPPVRRDLRIVTLNHNGEDILVFQDMLGYVPDGFALHRDAEPILSLLNGRQTVSQIRSLLNDQVSTEEIQGFIDLLDQNAILDSSKFRKTSAEQEILFEKADLRPPVLAGEVYPVSPEEIRDQLSLQFDKQEQSSDQQKAKALYAPHIDPRVHESVYAEAFSHIRYIKPKRVVILATSHYAGLYPETYRKTPFIGSNKRFVLPHRTFEPDLAYLDTLSSAAGSSGFTIHDRAHRIEHSIELHLLYISHIWNHDFSIVPILVDSFDELLYMRNGQLGKQLRNFSRLLQEQDDEDTFYLISGDLSHVGKKFGDPVPAADMKLQVDRADQQFLTLSCNNQQEELLSSLQEGYNPYRICGFPPLFTWVSAFPDREGTLINYYWWDESERESAVSFGSILF